jgi:hypothetical protein
MIYLERNYTSINGGCFYANTFQSIIPRYVVGYTSCSISSCNHFLFYPHRNGIPTSLHGCIQAFLPCLAQGECREKVLISPYQGSNSKRHAA